MRDLDSLVGQTLGRCRLTQRVAVGGFGAVYRALDPESGEPRAVKIFHPHLVTRAHFRDQFVAELGVLSQLDHPNIVRVYHPIEERGLFGFAMEYVDGTTLRQILKGKGALPLPFARDIFLQICQAIAYAHAHQPTIVHCDLAPDNIMVRPSGAVKVTDFGVARSVFAHEEYAYSAQTFGKPRYMAPEQFEGVVSIQSDLYSLGVILYEMTIGRVPFAEKMPVAIYQQHKTSKPDPPRSVNPAIPAPLDALVLRALAKNPADRYLTVWEMARELQGLDLGTEGMPASAPPPPAKTAIRVETLPPGRRAEQVERAYDEGFALLENHEYARAISRFDEVLSLDPRHKDAWRSRMIAEIRLGETERAAHEEEQRRRAVVEDAVRQGRAHLAAAEWDRALQCFQHVLTFDPDHAEARTARTTCEDSIRATRAAAKERAGAIERHLKEARQSLAATRYEAVEESCAAVLALDASHPEARKMQMLARVEKTSRETKRTLCTENARVALATGDLDMARLACEEALRLDPSYAPAQEILVECRTRRAAGERTAAIARCCAEGEEHLRKAEYRAAAGSFERVLQLDPSHAAAHTGLDRAQAKLAEEEARARAAGSRTAEVFGPSAGPPPAARPEPRLVGRVRELHALDEAISQAMLGTGGCLVLWGAPGSGKGRLLAEAERHGTERNAHVLSATCVPGADAPLRIFRGLVYSTICELSEKQRPLLFPMIDRWGGEIMKIIPDFRLQIQEMGIQPDTRVDRADLAVFLPAFYVEVATRWRPVLMFLESVEHATLELAEVLRRFAQAAVDHPILLCASYSGDVREESTPFVKMMEDLQAAGKATLVKVDPLPRLELRKFVSALLDGSPASPVLVESIVKRAGNHCRAIAEAVRRLEEGHLIVKKHDVWMPKGEGADAAIAAGTEEALRQKVARLPAKSLDLLRLAAVLREDVTTFDLLQRASGHSVTDLYYILNGLVAEKILSETVDGRRKVYAPATPNFAREVYEKIPAKDRQRLHKAAGLALEESQKDGLATPPERIANHFQIGEEFAKGAKWFLAATDAALSADQRPRAQAFAPLALQMARKSGVKSTLSEATARMKRLGMSV
ncbi:MAG: protein kinase [Planctomycetes bacterium]|nr:protein kinase [Planctomycetota bacterium]